VADADGRNPHAFTAFAANRFDQDPAWSPDGTRIAFTRNTGDNAAVVVVRVSDGALLAQIPAPYGISATTGSRPGHRTARTSASPGPRSADPVTGRTGRRGPPGNPGGSKNNSFTVDQSIPTPDLPPNPDIVLLVDTTGAWDRLSTT